jgi:hypothetical protein
MIFPSCPSWFVPWVISPVFLVSSSTVSLTIPSMFQNFVVVLGCPTFGMWSLLVWFIET